MRTPLVTNAQPLEETRTVTDRADWEAFLAKLYADPKNAVPCCPPLDAMEVSA